MKKLTSAMVAFTMLAATMPVGCGNNTTQDHTVNLPESDVAAVTGGGSLTLSVNPEIRLDYDENGFVTNVVAENKDGEAILLAVDEPVGMPASEALRMLVKEIEAQGYFVDKVEDEKRMVVVRFESDAKMPFDSFAGDVTKAAQQAVNGAGTDNVVVTIGTQDYDASFTSGDYITKEKAEEIALGYIGVTADGVVFEEREFDLDDGVAVYELEFAVDGVMYEVDVDAISGTVLKAKQKKDDDNKGDVIPEVKYITYEQAKQAALDHVGVTTQDAVFGECDGLDRENGVIVYEIELVVGGAEYELEIDALDGHVLGVEQEDEKDDDDDEDDRIAEDASFIGTEQAKRIALEEIGADENAVKIDDVELDSKKGVIVYEVECEVDGIEYEYHIDAVNGDILKIKTED